MGDSFRFPEPSGTEASDMTREIKLALILGSALVLVVGVLISDHLSGARNARIAQVDADLSAPPAAARTTTIPAITEPERNGWALPLGPRQANAEPAAPAVSGALADPNATLAQANDPTTTILPSGVPDSAPQLTADEQIKTLEQLARQEGIELGYVDPPAAKTVPFIPNNTQPTAANNTPTPTTSSNEIVVREGDTLWGLAEIHLGTGAAFTKLLEANKDRIGSDGEIRAGTRLRLPASQSKSNDAPSSKPATKPANEPAKNDKPSKADSKPSPRTYTIKKGDTLGSIASSQLGTAKRWKEIQDANPGLKPTDLRVGQSIKLPPK